VLITPDIRPTRREGIQLASREAARPDRAAARSAKARSSRRFRLPPGHGPARDRLEAIGPPHPPDRQGISVERNNNIILAIDSGRTMCEPMDGVPRVDSAVSAALLTAFVALKQGDRIGLFAFDAKPRASSKVVSGPGAFNLLQRVAAGIDYSANETNYTLALATLATGLKRRALVIVFTEFTDTVSAELMLAALGPLLGRHLLLFVVLRDAELEGFTAAEPTDPDDISRAVTAAGLLRSAAWC
jgi:uncharacterized protein (DUF58 family)